MFVQHHLLSGSMVWNWSKKKEMTFNTIFYLRIRNTVKIKKNMCNNTMSSTHITCMERSTFYFLLVLWTLFICIFRKGTTVDCLQVIVGQSEGFPSGSSPTRDQGDHYHDRQIEWEQKLATRRKQWGSTGSWLTPDSSNHDNRVITQALSHRSCSTHQQKL